LLENIINFAEILRVMRFRIPFIKNETVYTGVPFIVFEKYPNYIGECKLNKVHLDLGFIKLVSRVLRKEICTEKVKLIEKYTGGLIRRFIGEPYKVLKAGVKLPEMRSTELGDSFVTNDNKYVGDIHNGWWYYKKNLVVTQKHPHGCALKLKKRKEAIIVIDNIKVLDITNIEGFVGYTRRGSMLFKLGDMLFDETWEPTEETLGKEVYNKFLSEYTKLYLNNLSTAKPILKETLPYYLWGYKKIETLEECEQAAINFSNYLS
jgi:hypothetical protein